VEHTIIILDIFDTERERLLRRRYIYIYIYIVVQRTEMTSAEDIARWGLNLEDTEAQDALSEAWNECRGANETWGGRGKGGRGLKMTVNGDSVSMTNVMLSFTG